MAASPAGTRQQNGFTDIKEAEVLSTPINGSPVREIPERTGDRSWNGLHAVKASAATR